MGDGNAAERPYRNDAFISYHHASDSAKAAHLRRGLQNFARSWRQLRALRVFLDKFTTPPGRLGNNCIKVYVGLP